MTHKEIYRRGVVFANGDLGKWPDGFEIKPDQDLIVASDGGYRHCRTWQVVPQLVVGDLDSIDPLDLEEIESNNVEILRYSPEKDETDLQLALQVVMKRGVSEIIVLGMLGARWDMTIANVWLLGASFLDRMKITYLHGREEIHRLHSGKAVSLFGRKGDILTLIPVTEKVEGICLTGLAYPLENDTLYLGSTRGVSNQFEKDRATIRFTKGRMLAMVTRRPTVIHPR